MKMPCQRSLEVRNSSISQEMLMAMNVNDDMILHGSVESWTIEGVTEYERVTVYENAVVGQQAEQVFIVIHGTRRIKERCADLALCLQKRSHLARAISGFHERQPAGANMEGWQTGRLHLAARNVAYPHQISRQGKVSDVGRGLIVLQGRDDLELGMVAISWLIQWP